MFSIKSLGFRSVLPGGTVVAMAATWSAIGALAAGLFGTLFYLGARIDAVGARVDGRIDGLEAKMDARFDSVNARIDAMSLRIDGLSAALGTHIDRDAI